MKGRINLILICLVFCVCYYSLEKKYDIQTLKETYALNTLNNEVVENKMVIEVKGLIPDKKDVDVGVKNTDILQKAVDDVSNSGGGTVKIPKGDFWFTVDAIDSKHIDKSIDGKTIRGHFVIKCRNNVLIEGAGMYETKLRVFGDFPHGLDMFHYRNHEAFEV